MNPRPETSAPLGPRRDYALQCGHRYWSGGYAPIAGLQLYRAPDAPALRHVLVRLPDWAADLGLGSPPGLLVDAACLGLGEAPPHLRCDWLLAAFHHLTGAFERDREGRAGPIHSYAARLGADARPLFEHAWVNRICLFLRRLAARELQVDEEKLFGPLPECRFHLTHDVDAVTKTLPIRLKQSAFHVVNAGRALALQRFDLAWDRALKALSFAAGAADYWCFPQILGLERRAGVRSVFHFSAKAPGRTTGLLTWLMDPSYDVARGRLPALLGELRDGGWTVGLHQAFHSWRDSGRMAQERACLEAALGGRVECCRQHWLRFSWRETWAAQEAAGLSLDYTLGFNDRPGFRNGSALRHHPFDEDRLGPRAIEVVPLVLMDSHVYDYAVQDDDARWASMERIVAEVKAVRGEASLLWHQRVMHPDYGWAEGYARLLQMLD